MSLDTDIEIPAQLISYLRNRAAIEPDETPRCSTLGGGVSNRTVLVERDNGDAWVLKQALAKLRVKVDWFSPPERIHREADGLRWLERLAPSGATVPLLFEDHRQHIIAMSAVPAPHANWKTMLLDGDLHLDHVEQFARLLGVTQRRAWEQRDTIEPIFRDRGFFESLRLEPYFAYTASQVAPARDFLETLIADIRARPITLVHGDYSPKNVLVHNHGLVLLDHEVIHWGDPAFDLGFGQTHFLSKAHHLPARRAEFAEASRRHWQVYRDAIGDVPWADGLEPRAVLATLGCLLGRVAGRSPLEYLNDEERGRQQTAVLALMPSSPQTFDELGSAFLEEITDRAKH